MAHSSGLQVLNVTAGARGFCAETAEGWEGDCATGLQGAWPWQGRAACIERCTRCRRCNFVSFSDINRDCSWYHACALDSLNMHAYNGESYTTVHVGRRQPRARHRCAPLRQPRPMPAKDVHVITFHSEGPPQDAGRPLSAHAGVLEAGFAPWASSFHAYVPSEVRTLTLGTGEAGASVVAADAHQAVKNPGLAAIGHMASKPFVLLHRMESLPDGAWLLFVDANVIKHVELLAGAPTLRRTFEALWNATRPAADVFMPHEAADKQVRHFCKAFAVRALIAPEQQASVWKYPIHQANRIVVRVSAASRALLREWLAMCARRTLLAPLPNPDPHPSFQWHTPEQCLFTLLIATRSFTLHGDTRADVYADRLRFCYGFDSARAQSLRGGRNPKCLKPRAAEMRRWLPTRPSRQGRCLAIECGLDGSHEGDCNDRQAKVAWLA